MASIELTPRAPFGAITAFRASNFVANIADGVVAWVNERVENRRTAEALARLSPAMLDDIGLTRADVISLQNKF